MTLHITCNDSPLESLVVHVPGVGPWFAELRFVDDALEVPQGPVTIHVGAAELKATIRPELDGSFALRRQALALGGAGGWGKMLKALSYHNDAGVKALQVVSDAAREVGETLGTFAPTAASLGSHYGREAGSAAHIIEDVIGSIPWWVGFDGITHVAQRTATAPGVETYQVLNAWPDRNYVELGLDDIRDIAVGSTLTERLPAPVVVKSLEFTITPDKLRALCFCYAPAKRSKLADALESIARRAVDGPLWGSYRYRVGAIDGDRVSLQAVRKAAGVPDIMAVPMWPGLAGAFQRLALGAEVVVQFLDGERSSPIVTNFVGKGGPGFVPEKTTIGGSEGLPAARKGDTVTIMLPPAIFNGTIGGAPASGVLVFPTNQTLGNITIGSSKVDIAT